MAKCDHGPDSPGCFHCELRGRDVPTEVHKPASCYTDEGLVQLALELHARACMYPNKALHERALEAKNELLGRLKKWT